MKRIFLLSIISGLLSSAGYVPVVSGAVDSSMTSESMKYSVNFLKPGATDQLNKQGLLSDSFEIKLARKLSFTASGGNPQMGGKMLPMMMYIKNDNRGEFAWKYQQEYRDYASADNKYIKAYQDTLAVQESNVPSYSHVYIPIGDTKNPVVGKADTLAKFESEYSKYSYFVGFKHKPMIVFAKLPYYLDNQKMKVKFEQSAANAGFTDSNDGSFFITKAHKAGGGKHYAIKLKLKGKCYAIPYNADGTVKGTINASKSGAISVGTSTITTSDAKCKGTGIEDYTLDMSGKASDKATIISNGKYQNNDAYFRTAILEYSIAPFSNTKGTNASNDYFKDFTNTNSPGADKGLDPSNADAIGDYTGKIRLTFMGSST